MYRPVAGAGESAMKRAARPLSYFVNSSRQSNRRRKASVLAMTAISSAALAALSQSAMAQSLYWDVNGNAAGTSATSTGSWDLTSTNWTTDSTGAIATSVWTTGNTAVFSAGTTGTGTFNVTVPTGVTVPGVSGFTFEEGTVTIDGAG